MEGLVSSSTSDVQVFSVEGGSSIDALVKLVFYNGVKPTTLKLAMAEALSQLVGDVRMKKIDIHVCCI